MARVSNIGATFRVMKQETLAATKALLVKTAKVEHAKIMADHPAPSSFVRIVDGKTGAPEEAVKATGRIIYHYSRIEEVVEFSLVTLQDISPVLSGDYRKAHHVFLNGHPAADLSEYQAGDDLMITNLLPYARKIEVGKMTMRVAGTSKVYQQARRIVMNRFGNSASVEFTFRAVIGGQVVDQAKAATGRRPATGTFEKTLATGIHNKPDMRYPCLVIRER
ncbi:hypothetical protein OIU34_00615 [Pararhizobium sp. BT-229]|uniref:hypothetical protein n=1 Tax=Pararhizobium sp. BT-229 TaxID=2986923 RepID=UPI0021F7158A|nr:hypothetical protein [Pararhizobium sp. BT-229]MCV9960388.1 hypothetical protein [Pararhizobium sp. BT-229]